MVFELLHEKVRELLRKRGFDTPTLPQKKAIPEIIKGKNVLIIGPTGHGKTEAALLPVFSKILEVKPKPISMLYITPLKSLNRDILDRILWWAKHLGIGVTVRHGDTTQYERKLQVEHPDEIFIITPEQLQAMLTGKKIRKHLENVKWVVIDELHELVESKRGVQLSVALERLKEICKKFQIISLSATISSPREAAKFIGCEEVLDAQEVKEHEIEVTEVKVTKDDRKLAEKVFLDPESVARIRFIKNLSEKYRSVLVFTNTRETAEVLSSRLRVIYPDLPQEVHHSSLSRRVRIKSEKEFKEGKLKVLLATSSLELGIDIGTIDCVIQYMSPRQVVKFLQRIGRSRHRVGEKSHGFIISGGGDDIFESAVIARFATERKLEELNVYKKAYDVLTQQILGLLIEGYENEKEIYEIIKRSYPYRNLSYSEFKEALKLMEEIKLIWTDRGLRKRRKGLLHYFENLTTIPDNVQYKVVDISTNTPIGNLDESWVAEHAEIGEVFIVKGSPWKIVGIEGNKVFAEPVMDIDSAIPTWEGEMIPVPFEIAQEVCKLRRSVHEWIKIGKDYAEEKLKSKYFVSEYTAKKMVSFISSHTKSHPIPDEKTIMFENYSEYVIIHAPFGSKVNETIGKCISALLSAEYGESIGVRTDPYRIVIIGAKLEDVKNSFLKLRSEDVEILLKLFLPRTNLFKYRFIHVAKRFGVIRKGAKYDKISIAKIIEIFKGTQIEKEVFREIFHDKLDVEKTKEILRMIHSGEFKIIEAKGLSDIGKRGLRYEMVDIVKPERMEKDILRVFKKRLFESKIKIICINCGKYSENTRVANLPEHPVCKACGSRLLSVVKINDTDAIKIVRKYLRGVPLSEEESKKLEKMRSIADLVIVHGKKACIALSARGIGPKNASRILARMHADEESFIKDIYKAEKQFLKTRRYWEG